MAALARWLLLGSGLAEGSERTGSGFLVNLEALFEATVARALRENGIEALPKQPLAYGRWTGERVASGSAFEIDVLCRGLACGTLIVDAKYKRQVSSANLQQMLAYCALTGATRGAFVVPAGMVSDCRAYVFRGGAGATVRVDVLELSTDSPDVSGWREHGRALAKQVLGL